MGQGLRKFGELPWNEKLLFSEAYFLHLATGLILKFIPFRWIPGVFSSRQFETPAMGEAQSRHAVPGRQSENVELIKMAIARTGRVSPWRNRCLVSSLAARLMLRRRKINSEISLGVTKDVNNRLRAHAWIISGETEIITMGENFTILQTF